MKRSDIKPYGTFFDRYINTVKEQNVLDALENSKTEITHLDTGQLAFLGNKVYAPGKWTIKDIVQHVIDSERVFACRALRFARHDKTPLPGYDENLFAQNAHALHRTLDELLDELKTLKDSTMQLYKSFQPAEMNNTGIASGHEISVFAIGFVIAGHQTHHINIIREKYLPLL
jgi:hypothetical protein